jgi:hypothetical protein
MRGLKSTCPQLSLPVGDERLGEVWGTMSPTARERVLRLLAGVVSRVVTAETRGTGGDS